MPNPATLRARALRRDMTPAERRLWALLRRRQTGVKFRRQEPVGQWIADFLSHSARLIVEVDGETHATPEGLMRDTARTASLRSRGFRVLRFSNAEVFANPEGVWEAIVAALPPPS
jgi:very-short-patch-repair endonuclease